MSYKTFVSGEILTASDVNTYLMKQSVPSFATTGDRDVAITSASEGQTAYIESNDTYTFYNGSSWQTLVNAGAWTAFTPSTTGITAGNGTFDCAYAQVGKTVFVRGAFTLGSTSSITTNVSFNMPVTGANSNRQFGHAVFQQSTFYNGMCFMTGGTYVNFYAFNSSGTYSSLTAISGIPTYVPVQWLTGHVLSFVITYQAA
jgi:hypothetical protein